MGLWGFGKSGPISHISEGPGPPRKAQVLPVPTAAVATLCMMAMWPTQGSIRVVDSSLRRGARHLCRVGAWGLKSAVGPFLLLLANR